MLQVLSEVLPLAVGVSASAAAVIALVLILQGDRATSSGSTFTLGWLAGVGAVCATGIGLGIAVASDPVPWTQWLRVILGFGLLFQAGRTWQTRTPADQNAAQPKWMAGLQQASPRYSGFLGFALGSINPLGAAAAIGNNGLAPAEIWIVSLAYVFVASLCVAIPMTIYLLMRSKAEHILGSLGSWMGVNSAGITITVLLIFGIKLTLGGIAGLIG
jgi:hypothetical protein